MAEIQIAITDKIAWLLSKPKRIKIAVGGRGSQKSTGVGDIMLMFADSGERICCTREFQNSIDDSVHENLKAEIDRLDIEGMDVQSTCINTASGGEIFYKGLARNITSLKSLAGVHRLWIEEGESVSNKSLKILTPSVRSSASANENDEDPPEIWITMNRGSSHDAVAQKYLRRAEADLAKTGYYEDDLMMVVEVNWRDNPWFPPELEQERLDDLENLSRQEYDHIWEGRYNDSVENAIIRPEWFDAAIDAHIHLGFEPRGAKIVSHDPSDSGDDPKGLVYRHGSVILEAMENEIGDVNEGCDWALDFAIDVGADWFIYDSGGMGLSLRRQVNQSLKGKKVQIVEFNGASSVYRPGEIYTPDGEIPGYEYEGKRPRSNKEMFKNLRAQLYCTLRDGLHNAYKAVVKGEYIDPDKIISISSKCTHLKKFRTEVLSVPKKHNPNNVFQIKTKQEMAKDEIPSPNIGDSAMMSIDLPDARRKTGRKIEVLSSRTAYG